MHQFRSFCRVVLVALAATALIVPLRHFVFVQILDLRAPFLPFLVAVVSATWIAGLWSGLCATLFSAAVVAYPMIVREGIRDIPTSYVSRFLIFIVIGALASWLLAALHIAQRRMVRRQRQLAHEVTERRKAVAAERTQRQQLAVEINRRAEAEQAVREREERMRMAVDSADIGTWDFDPVTGERNWSERAKIMFGLAPDADVSDVSYLDRIHPDDRAMANEAVQRAMDPDGNGRYEIECRLLLPDAAIRWFVVKGQAFFAGENESRHAIRFIGTLMETTERKKAEQALRQAEERYRKLATHAPVGIFHTDDQGRCLFVNEAWCAIVGVDAEQAMGDGWARFLHPEDRQRVVMEWKDAARNSLNQASEFRFLNQHTGTRWVAASAIALQDDAGTVTEFVGTIVDLTDRKAVEDVIRADEARLRSVLDNTPAVISLKDLQGRYVLVNRVWEETYGVRNDDIVGRTNFDLLSMTKSDHMSQGIAERFATLERQVIDTGAPIDFEDPVPDGEDQRLFVTVKFPIKDATAAITGVGGISIDITERRKAIDAVEAERTLLRQTLELQDHERQVIAYEIHDGLIQYAAGALMQLESMRFQETFKPAADSINSLVGNLRRAVAEGRRIMNGIRTPVLDGLGVVAALEHLIHEEDRAHVRVEFIKDEAIERMDPRIEEAIYRITQEALTNIGKHSQSKSVRVELGRRGGRVHLEVRDWGVGFAPAKRLKGTYGLRGMTERARIVGGMCQIESTPGDGTRVVVDLPYQPGMR
jgi:PAS domain S-box-containing protein